MSDHTGTTRRQLLITAGGMAAIGLAGCTGTAQQSLQSGGGAAPTATPDHGDEGDHAEGDHHDDSTTDTLAAQEKTAEAHHGDPEAHSEDDGHGMTGPSEHMTVEMITNDSGHHFHPHVSWVEVGGTVEFVNQSGAHTATAYHPDNDKPLLMPETAESFDSGLLSEAGATFEHTFETEGIYHIYCLPHEALGMIGTVIVGQPDPHDQPALAELPGGMPDRVTTKIESLNHTVNEALGHTHDDGESDDGDGDHQAEADSGHDEEEEDGHHEETEGGHHEETESGHHEETESDHHDEESGHHDEETETGHSH